MRENALNAVSRSPSCPLFHFGVILLQNIETDVAIEDIGVRNAVEDSDCWWVVWVALGEFELEVEYSAFIRSLFGASYVCVPCEEVCIEWSSSDTDSGDFLILDFFEVLDESLVRECEQFLIE